MTRLSRPPRPIAPAPRTIRRRAAIGLAWTVGWTAAWGLAIFGYAHRPQAAEPAVPVAKIGRR
jgi:hypothetical protein